VDDYVTLTAKDEEGRFLFRKVNPALEEDNGNPLHSGSGSQNRVLLDLIQSLHVSERQARPLNYVCIGRILTTRFHFTAHNHNLNESN
jgi:hypothetical protein